MNIVYISSSIIPSRTANSIHSMKMCQALAKLGHQVSLLARKGRDSHDQFKFYGVEPIIKVVPLAWPNSRIGGAIYGCNILRYLANWGERADFAYGRNIHGLLAANMLGYPIVYEAHAPPGNIGRRLEERCLLRSPKLKRLITISSSLRDEYLRLFPRLDDKVEIIVAPDGADHETANERMDRSEKWPGRWYAHQIGYVGHLYPGKGAEIILKIAGRLPEFDFHLIGGRDEDINYWKSRAILDNIYFHGFVKPSKISRYYDKFDTLLLPCGRRVSAAGGTGDISRWMSPLKLFEYMASGKAIVASDLPVLREILVDGVNCKLASPDDPSEWVKALRLLVQDRAYAMKLGDVARTEFIEKYTWKCRAQKILQGLKIN